MKKSRAVGKRVTRDAASRGGAVGNAPCEAGGGRPASRRSSHRRRIGRLETVRRCSIDELRAADVALSQVARGENARLVALGEALSAIEQSGVYTKLGYSSFGAYVAQRVERPRAWAEDLVRLVRRLEKLPRLREVTLSGRATISHAQLVARNITPEEDAVWADLAARLTVPQLRQALAERKQKNEEAASAQAPVEPLDEDDEKRSISRSATFLQKVLFEAALMRLDAVAGFEQPIDEVLEGAVAEAEVTMINRAPVEIASAMLLDLDPLANAVLAREESVTERLASERRAEASLPKREAIEVVLPGEAPGEPVALDRYIHRTSQMVLAADLKIGRLSEIVLAGRNWKRLGYGSPNQLAKERTGLSLQKLRDARRLARSAREHPALGKAVAEGRIGKASATMIAGVALSAAAAQEWVARAAVRTVKDLRNDVRAARLLELRKPPTDEQFQKVVELQRAVAGYVDPNATRQISVDDKLTSARPTELRWRVSEVVFERFHLVEARYRAWGQPEGIFIEFMTKSVFDSWPLEPTEVEYGDVYARDRHTCLTPFCVSRWLQPHHIRFRSQGGGDERENIASICGCDHLELIHALGVIRLTGRAPDHLVWEIGPPDARWVIRGRDVIKRPDG